jgi:peptidoglycan/xylan/chitin deacetylase (PgdA/CDA1 family)
VVPNASPYVIDAISPQLFERQIASLTRHFTLLSVEQIGEILASGGELPWNVVAITFDDGYEDNYEHAFPILKKHGVSATFFLATGYIGTVQMLWFDKVLTAFRQTSATELQWEVLAVPLPLETDVQRVDAALAALTYLRGLGVAARNRAIADLFRVLSVESVEADMSKMLSWDQVREMAAAGHSFGSHTVTHPILSRLSAEEVFTEVRDSKERIERETGKEVTAFAYPSGRRADFTDEVESILQRVGYRMALTNSSFGSNSSRTPVYCWNRIRPWEAHVPTFLLKLCLYKWLNDGAETKLVM